MEWRVLLCDAAVLDVDDVGSSLHTKMVEEYPIDEIVYISQMVKWMYHVQRMALQASDLITRRMHFRISWVFDDSEYIPTPIMEMHGVFDEIAQYSNSVRIALLEEDSQNIEAIQSEYMRISMIGPILMV